MQQNNDVNEIKHSGFSIGKFSVTKPVLINILMITILALGVFSIIRLPQEQFAEVPFFWVNVIVPYPGASAADLESSVTIPVENAFQGISKLKRISSTTSEGLSVVRVEFDDGISNEEFRTLFQDAQTRFSQVTLPDGVIAPLVDDFSSADFLPVVEVIISGDLPYEQLRREAVSLRDQILRVKDVSDVQIIGLPERQILVNLDPNRLVALGLSVQEVLRAIQDQNRIIPGGTLNTGSREYVLRTLGSITNFEDVGSVIVRRSTTGGIIRVNDVAQVVDGFDPDSSIARFNGEPSVSLRVTKIPRGSSVSVVSGTKEIVNQRMLENPEGITLTLFNDSTVQIASSLSVLTTNAAMGLVILVFILWLFIGFRNAMMTALGIPVTFALTFLILDLLGETINTNTLFGLVLVLGLVVDHAIVIIENSYRLQQSGLRRADAAILGTNQVVWPVIAATATTIAAFLPLMLIPGTIGKFLRVIPLTVTIALIASTGEALWILPSHFAEWGREKSNRRRKRKEAGWWFEYVKNVYSKIFSYAYRWKKIVLPLFLIIAVATFALIGLLAIDLFSAEDYSYFSIDITTPRGTPLSVTNAVVAEFEKVLLPKIGNGEILSISTSVGNLSGGSGSSSNSTIAQITIDLAEQDEGRVRSIDEIIQEIERETYYIIGPEQVFFRKAQTGPPTSAPLNYRLSGDNYEEIIDSSRALANILSSIDGVSNIESDFSEGSPELRITIQQERASELGITLSSLGSFIRARFDKVLAGTFFQNNEEIDIVLRLNQQGSQYEDLAQALIPTEDGRIVPLSSVAIIELSSSFGSIRRVDGKREITVSAEVTEGIDLREIDAIVETYWNETLQGQFNSVLFSTGGEFSEFASLIVDILRVFLLGIFLIYLILGAQFNSYSQPLLIIICIPFAFVGVILYLFFSGVPFSTTVIYAGVALAGIAVNDAIVLISFINDLRKEGKSVRDAIFEATKSRLRPIMLTSFTTIGGLLPTALGLGGSSVVWGPMASTIMFGLIFSTMSALFILPLLYGLLYDRVKGRTKRGRA